MPFRSQKNKFYKGLLAGSIGGLVASWIMPRFQSLLALAVEGQSYPHSGEGEDATVKTAEKISSGLLDRELSEKEKKAAGPLVHYSYGTGLGALYGGVAQRYEITTSGFGSAYGAAAWALGDEVALPVLGLGRGSTEIPVSRHLQALAAHLVYGMTLESVRRLALRVL